MNSTAADFESPITANAVSPFEVEVRRIRALTSSRRHGEALAAAEALATTAPDSREVLYLLAVNQRYEHRINAALSTLERLEQAYPRFSRLHQERGHCYVAQRDAHRAIEALQRCVTINPALSTSWKMLERLYRMTGDTSKAATAAEQLAVLGRLSPELVRARSLFSDGEVVAAESIVRAYLLQTGRHLQAMDLLARIRRQCGRFDESERLLDGVLQLVPADRAARLEYVRVLIDRLKYQAAKDEIEALLNGEPDNAEYLLLFASVCAGLGDHDRAILLYRRLLEGAPVSAELRLMLAHSLKTRGRQAEAVECYRAAAAARPSFGDAYWSLANLKTYHFSPEEIACMLAEEAAPHARAADRLHLCFALGRAFEDRGEYAQSWAFYERGNALKRASNPYTPRIVEDEIEALFAVCTPQFFAARRDVGVPHPDPIFVVGLPRAGSTLIEQILSSHSEVEGTHELPDLERIVGDLGRYPAVLAELPAAAFRKLGARYLNATRAYRKGKSFFIDKMPNNFRHIGLIHLLLPNAIIIDARREPMACCFGNFKQLFARGQDFTYSIDDIARYYRAYLDVMRHWDAVLPGRVLRVSHEDIVENLEDTVRRMLDFCGLELQPACVEFWKTERSVYTASSEQVRQPIFRHGLSQWRNYEPWLGPLKDALGDALIRYRE